MAEFLLSQVDFKSPQLVRQEAQVAMGLQSVPKIGNFITPEDAAKKENAVWKVLDVLSRGEYMSANFMRWTMGREDLDPFGALQGTRKTTYFDIAEDMGLEGAAKFTVGMIGGIFFDPTTYLGIGALGKVGRLAKIIGSRLEKGEKIKDLLKMRTRMGRELRLMTNNGLDITRLERLSGLAEVTDIAGRAKRAETLLQQAQRKQRFFLTFMGRGITPAFINEPALKYLGKTGDFLMESGLGKWARGIISANIGIRVADDLRREANNLARSRSLSAMQAARPVFEILRKLKPAQKEAIAKVIQRGGPGNQALMQHMIKEIGLDPKAAEQFAKDTKGALGDLWTFEQSKGITGANKIEGDLEYYTMTLTPKAKKALEKKGIVKLPKDISKWNDGHTSLFERNFKGLDTVEVNAKGRAGELVIEGVPLGKLDFDFFTQDLDRAIAIRFLRTARASVSAEYLQRMDKALGMMERVKVADDAGNILRIENDFTPIDFVPVKNPFINQKYMAGRTLQRGVAGGGAPIQRVFPPEVAKQIDEVFDRLVSSDEINKFGDLFAQMQGAWKASVLAVFPAYHARNFAGNAWMYFLSGAWKDPGSLIDGMRLSVAKKHYGTFGGATNPFDTEKIGKFRTGSRLDTDAGDAFEWNEVWTMAKDRGMLGGTFAVENEGRVRSAIRTSERNWKKVNPLSADFSPYQWGFAGGSKFVEDPWRLGLFIHNLKKGLSPDAAAIDVRKWFYDYFDFSKVEQEWFRNLIPFYAWLRNNIPSQFEQAIQQPGKILIAAKVKRGLEKDQIMTNPSFVPEWMKAGMPIQIRENPDDQTTEYMLLKTWLPPADLADVFDPQRLFGDALTPFLKEPYQQWKNFDGRYKSKIERTPGELTPFLGMPMEKRLTHLLRNVRLLNTAHNMFFNNKRTLAIELKKQLTGISTFPVDPEKQRRRKQIELSQLLSDVERGQAFNIRKWTQGDNRTTALANIKKLETQRLELEEQLRQNRTAPVSVQPF